MATSELTQIGPYRVGALLGKGAHGEVYEASCNVTGRRVALKTLPLLEANLLQALRREIAVLSAFELPGLVQILDHGMHEGRPWLVTTLLEGRNLIDDIRVFWSPDRAAKSAEGPRREIPASSLSGILTRFQRLCITLAQVHGRGFVHGDIKPANIIMTADSRPVLLDLGTARRVVATRGRAALSAPGPVTGTLAFMPPEQLKGRTIDARADLYAVGCLLFIALSGVLPYQQLGAVLDRQSRPTPLSELLLGVPSTLADLVGALLESDREQRFGHAWTLALRLGELGGQLGADDMGERPADYLYTPGLHGREGPWTKLSSSLGHAHQSSLSGVGRVGLITGESGIGKTHLLLDLSQRAHRLGYLVVAGGQDIGPTNASQPAGHLQQLIRLTLDLLVDDQTRADGEAEPTAPPNSTNDFDVRVLSQYLDGPSGEHNDTKPVDGLRSANTPLDATRVRFCRHLERAVTAAHRRTPMVLFFDDLHLADSLTTGFLEHVLLVGWTGPTAIGAATLECDAHNGESEAAILRLSQDPNVQHVALGPLSGAAIGLALRDMLAEEPPPRLAETAERLCGGNPFAVSAFIQTLIDRGDLARDHAGRWRFSAIEADWLTRIGAADEVAKEHLSALSSGARVLAQACALFGKPIAEVQLATLARALEVQSFGETMSELLRSRVVATGAGGTIAIAHNRLRLALEAGLSAPARVSMHSAIATMLAGDGLRGRSENIALGYHWSAAGEAQRARAILLRNAEHTVALGALAEAEGFYQQVLDDDELPASERFDVSMRLARVRQYLGKFDDTLSAFAQAAEAANTSNANFQKVEVLEKSARWLADLGHLDAARVRVAAGMQVVASLNRGFRQVEQRVRTRIAQLLDVLGVVDRQAGALLSAVQHHRSGLNLLPEGPGSRLLRTEILRNLAVALQKRGDLASAQANLTEALDLLSQLGDRPRERALTQQHLGSLYRQRGQVQRGCALYRGALRTVRQIGDRATEGILLGNLAAAHTDAGDFEGAEALYRPAISVLSSIGNRRAAAICLANLGVLITRRRRFRDAFVILEKALGLHVALENRRSEGVTLLNMGAIQVYFANPIDALELLDTAAGILEEVGDELFSAWACYETAVIRRRIGHLPTATRLVDVAFDRFTLEGAMVGVALCHVERAHLALASGSDPTTDITGAKALATPDDLAGTGTKLGMALAGLELAAAADREGRELWFGELEKFMSKPILAYVRSRKR